MSAHTPGPWHPTEDGCDFYVEPLGDSTVAVCSVLPIDSRGQLGDYTRGATTHANARLIAAAPELLAMLVRLRDAGEWCYSALEFRLCEDGHGLYNDMMALIAKAEGGAA